MFTLGTAAGSSTSSDQYQGIVYLCIYIICTSTCTGGKGIKVSVIYKFPVRGCRNKISSYIKVCSYSCVKL